MTLWVEDGGFGKVLTIQAVDRRMCRHLNTILNEQSLRRGEHGVGCATGVYLREAVAQQRFRGGDGSSSTREIEGGIFLHTATASSRTLDRTIESRPANRVRL